MHDAKILMVDDSTDIRDGMVLYLETEGFDVKAASSGEAALEMLRKVPYDLIITDLKMLETDGMAVLAEAKKKDPLVEVIIITSYGTIADNIQAKKLGVSAFFTKPVYMPDMLASIRQGLARRKGLLKPAAPHHSHIDKELSTQLALGSSLNFILKSACESFDADGGTLLLREVGSLVIKMKTDNFRDSILGTEVPLEAYAPGPGPWIKAEKLNENPCYNGFISPLTVKSGLSIPVFEGTELLGVLNLSRCGEKPDFTREDSVLAADFAAHIKFSLENAVAYAELGRAKVYVEKILDSMLDGLMVMDPDGIVRTVNGAVLNMGEYRREDMLGKPASGFFTLAGEDGTHALFNIKDHLGKTAAGYYESVCFLTGHNRPIPVGLASSAMYDKNGALEGIVCVMRDMRETQRLIALARESAETAGKRAVELQEAYDKLKAANTEVAESQKKVIQASKMAAVGQLAGGVAHELNNPLGIILGFAQSVVKKADKEDPLYAPLKTIEREALRCKGLVSELLKFSRIEKPQMEPVNIHALVEDTLLLVAAKARVKNVQVNRDCEESMPRIMANKNQIQQLLVNLCNNAIDAMPKGGTLTIRTRHNSNEKDARVKTVEISVSDTGVGMSEDVKKHLFVPFFTTKEAGQGTGLGLSLCYEIVQKHNGTIAVDSEPGKGTTFRTNLPVT